MMKKSFVILIAALLSVSVWMPAFVLAEDISDDSAVVTVEQAAENTGEAEQSGNRQEENAGSNLSEQTETSEAEEPAESSGKTQQEEVSKPEEPPKETEDQAKADTETAEETVETAEKESDPVQQDNRASSESEAVPDTSETQTIQETEQQPETETVQQEESAAVPEASYSGEDCTVTEEPVQALSESEDAAQQVKPEENESKNGITEGGTAADEPAAGLTPTSQAEEKSTQLSTATDLKLTSTGLTSMTLTFKGDKSPTRYRVFRATSKNGTYTNLGEAWEPVSGKGSYYFEDQTAKKNIIYYYKVRAFISNSGKATWGEKYSAIISGTTKPAAPEKLSGKSTAAKTVKVSWTVVSGASGYQVARSANLYSGYTLLKTITTGDTVSYSDKTVKTGMQYYYRVRAFYTPASGSTIYGPFTYSSVILCQPVAPKNFSISAKTDTTVSFSWTAATDIEYYLLTWTWKEDGATQKKEAVIASSRTSYKVSGLAAGTDYTFEIRSIAFSTTMTEMRSGIAVCRYSTPAAADESRGSGTDTISGSESGTETAPASEAGDRLAESTGTESPSDNGEAGEPEQTAENAGIEEAELKEEGEIIVPAEEPETGDVEPSQLIEKEEMVQTPVISSWSASSSGIMIKWKMIPGAASYMVYRSEKQKSGYKLTAKGLAEPIFLDTSAAQCSGYYYKVTAVDDTGKKLTSEPKGVFFATGPAITAKKGSDGYYTLTWDSTRNAEQYRVYRSENGGGYVQVKILSSGERSWKDTGVQAGKSYAYYIRSGKKVDGNILLSSLGTEKTVYVGVRNNPVLKISQGVSLIYLTWDKVSNASGYAVYGAKGDESLKLLATVDSKTTSWSETPPAASGYLKYYVRAYYTLGKSKKYAPKSDPVVIRRLAAPQIKISRGSGENTVLVSWSRVSGAKGYRVYYRTEAEEDYTYLRTDGLTLEIPAQGGQKIYVYVRAEVTEEVTFVGSRSTVKSMTPYWKFALLIGNNQYTKTSSLSQLAATAADVAGFSVVLDKQNGWKVNACANMTGEEMLSAISRFFSAADKNSTCLFYYSGHGMQGYDETTGSLCGIDGSYVTTAQLKAALGKYPGKSIVLMDSCGSGAAVENDSGAETLTDGDTSVIAAAEAHQSSWATLFYSYFTYYLSYGSGYDVSKQVQLSSTPADTDKDGIVSFQEICAYIGKYLEIMGNAKGVTQTVTYSLPDPEASIY